MTKSISLKKQVSMYLKHRDHMVYVDAGTKSGLSNFIKFASLNRQTHHLTIDLAVKWATTQAKNCTHTSWARRLVLLRGFAKFSKVLVPKTEIPPSNIFGPTAHRPTPHIYTNTEISNLMNATKQYQKKFGFNAITLKYIIGLLSCTGLRVSEVIKLNEKDVDLMNGVLTIHESKAHKSRYVPLHPTAISALKRYLILKHKYIHLPLCNNFFINKKGKSIIIGSLEVDYRLLRKTAGLNNNPRLYDLRHTFACRRLEQWYEEQKNIDLYIVYLSVYLGHSSVGNTYWYLSATPELMSIVSKRFEKFSHSWKGGSS